MNGTVCFLSIGRRLMHSGERLLREVTEVIAPGVNARLPPSTAYQMPVGVVA